LEALQDEEMNIAKKILATEATAMCHGRVAADEAAATATKTFEKGQIAGGLPTVNIPAGELTAGIAAFALLARAGLANSNGDARRLIRGGGARLNDEKIGDENTIVSAADSDGDGVIKLSAGKKRHVLVRQS
jgi:tyrosyl-tRNA synthetase